MKHIVFEYNPDWRALYAREDRLANSTVDLSPEELYVWFGGEPKAGVSILHEDVYDLYWVVDPETEEILGFWIELPGVESETEE